MTQELATLKGIEQLTTHIAKLTSENTTLQIEVGRLRTLVEMLRDCDVHQDATLEIYSCGCAETIKRILASATPTTAFETVKRLVEVLKSTDQVLVSKTIPEWCIERSEALTLAKKDFGL